MIDSNERGRGSNRNQLTTEAIKAIIGNVTELDDNTNLDWLCGGLVLNYPDTASPEPYGGDNRGGDYAELPDNPLGGTGGSERRVPVSSL